MRPLNLSVLLLCLGPLLYAQTAGVKEWTPDVLEKEFDRLDRRIASSERLLRPVERRIADLEEQLRMLRVKNDLLEAQLKKQEHLLEIMHRELAALADAVEAKTGVRPSITKPPVAPKGTPVPAGIASIKSQKVSMDADTITITGVIANTSDKPLIFVLVQAEFLDKEGKVVHTESAYTDPRVVPAGSTATFTLKARRDPRIQDHRLSLKTE